MKTLEKKETWSANFRLSGGQKGSCTYLVSVTEEYLNGKMEDAYVTGEVLAEALLDCGEELTTEQTQELAAIISRDSWMLTEKNRVKP